jgi:peptidoglycan/LPS O-acetylase OafA/YrhL
VQYVRALDGVRGIAVLLVMLFHFGYFPAGWVGVQIFFTLSGFLITSILLNSKKRTGELGRFLAEFYWRRSLRIFPLIFIFLIVMTIAATTFPAFRSFWYDWPYLFSYTANFGRLRQSDLGPPFVHLWSLAVEEQFYLVWPLLVYLLPFSAFRKTVGAILLISPIIRLVVYLTFVHSGESAELAAQAVYVLPFTQLDAFAAGAAIPLWGLRRLRYPGYLFLAATAMLAALGVAVLAYQHLWGGGAFFRNLGYGHLLQPAWEFVWGYSLLNVVSMLALVCALNAVGPFKTLDNPGLVEVGKVSYGVYVYHLPILVLLQSAFDYTALSAAPRLAFFIGYGTLVMLVSEASFYLIEGPFLKMKDYFPKIWSRKPAS